MPVTTLKVDLLTMTPDAEALIYAAMRQCYSDEDAAALFKWANTVENMYDMRCDKVEELIQKGLDNIQCVSLLQKMMSVLSVLTEVDKASTEEPLRAIVESSGFSAGQVFGLLRVAVTGQRVSPPLFESMEIIGKDIVLNRIKAAINLLE